MKERLGRTVRLGLILLLVGLAYLAFVLISGYRLPCPFFSLTGLSCPGCGVTRMIVALVEGDLPRAFASNPFLLLSSPLLVFLLAFSTVRYVRHGDMRLGRANSLAVAELVGAIAFGVLRNVL